MEIEFGIHALQRMEVRGVSREIVFDVLGEPDAVITAADEHNNTHYIKDVVQLGGDTVKLVVDPYKNPNKLVTVMRSPKKEVRL